MLHVAAFRAAIAIVAAAVVAGFLGSCGDDAKKQISDMLTSGLTTTDPAVICRQTLSASLVRRVYGSPANCITVETKDSKTSKPASAVELSGLKVQGDGGSVFAELKGGDQDGARGLLQVVKQGADWRLDDLSTEFLRSEFEAGVRNDRQLDAALKSCIAKKVLALQDAAFRALGYGSMGEKPAAQAELKRYVADCATQLAGPALGQADSGTASVLRKQFEKGLADSLKRDGISEAAIACVKRRLRSAISDKQIISLIGKSGKDIPPEIGTATAGALAACDATK